jgi:hypothetical protein
MSSTSLYQQSSDVAFAYIYSFINENQKEKWICFYLKEIGPTTPSVFI